MVRVVPDACGTSRVFRCVAFADAYLLEKKVGARIIYYSDWGRGYLFIRLILPLFFIAIRTVVFSICSFGGKRIKKRASEYNASKLPLTRWHEFATTETLVSQRSAELARFRKAGGVRLLYISYALRRSRKRLLLVPLILEGQFFSYRCPAL